MEFTVSKADLVRELSLSQGVVEKKTTIPILSNVLLEARGDRLYLTATDLELGLRTSCPAQVKKEGSGTIPARKLLDYVRLLPDADITVKFAENHWANFTCGRSRTRIAGMSRESFPELPAMPETIAEIPVKQLSAMIARTMFAISMEESRFTLNGALLLLGDKTSDDGGDRRASSGLRPEATSNAANGQRDALTARWCRARRWRRLRNCPTMPAPMRRCGSAATIIICFSNSVRGC